MIEIKLDDRGLQRALVELDGKLKKPTRALKEIGIYMMKSIDTNFDVEGRPERWLPLAPMTLALRRKGKKSYKSMKQYSAQTRILQDTGTLRKSITYELAGDDAVAIGTNVWYGEIHQFGKDVTIPARTIVPKKAKMLRFIVNGKVVFAKKVHQKARVVHIPARPFLLFQEEDVEAVNTIAIDNILR